MTAARLSRWLIPVLGLLIAASWAGAADDYTIRLQRPEKVGDKCVVTLTGTQKYATTMRINGKAPDSPETVDSTEIVGERQVLAVDKSGTATKWSCKIEKCVGTKKGIKTDLLVAGTTFVVEYKLGAPALTIDGKPLNGALLNQISAAVPRDDPIRVGADERIFGTSQQKKVGDKWLINSKEAANMMKGMLNEKPQAYTGEVTIVAIRKEQGVDCLEIEGKFDATHQQDVQRGGVMQSDLLDTTQVEVVFSGPFPIDPKMQPLRLSQTMHFIDVQKWRAGDSDMSSENRHDDVQTTARQPASASPRH